MVYPEIKEDEYITITVSTDKTFYQNDVGSTEEADKFLTNHKDGPAVSEGQAKELLEYLAEEGYTEIDLGRDQYICCDVFLCN